LIDRPSSSDLSAVLWMLVREEETVVEPNPVLASH
jgi:hypothetical protein